MILKSIRWILGKMILFLNRTFPARPLEITSNRTSQVQTQLDQITSHFTLYQFEACPFCVKVRREIKRLGLKIEIKDILKSKTFEEELIQGGGERQVPCLRVVEAGKEKESIRWIYESDEINQFLNQTVQKLHY